MTAETRAHAPLIVHGISHDDSAIWFSRGGIESYAEPHELAVLRRSIAHFGSTVWDGIRIDEADLDVLIRAMNEPQPLYPRESCDHCDRDATAKRGSDFLCGGHLSALGKAEDGAA